MVAVTPGAAAPPDGPSGNGSLQSLFEGRGDAGEPAASAGRARSGALEARATTIDLSATADPTPWRRGVVPLRHIVGARPRTGLWQARARRSVRVGGWLAGAITVGAGLLALWVLLFTTVSGGDVWLGRPLTPAKHDESATTQQSPGRTTGSLKPTSTAPPKPAASAATKAAPPAHTSGKSSGGSATATSSGTSGTSGTSGGSGTSGRGGADDPPGDDSGGTRTTTSTTTTTTTSGGSGSSSGGSGSGSGSGSSGGSGSSSGSGGHGSDD